MIWLAAYAGIGSISLFLTLWLAYSQKVPSSKITGEAMWAVWILWPLTLPVLAAHVASGERMDRE